MATTGVFSTRPEARGVAATTLDLLDPAKTESAAKWAAGGFGLLSALLTFVGLKDGVLDRLLRTEPDRAVFAVVLIGLGVVFALLAPALRTELMVRVWVPCVVVGVLGVVVTALGWYDTSPVRVVIAAAGFVLVFGAAVAFRGTNVSAIAAALVFALVTTAMGLYSAATMAVSSKSLPEDPRVTATLVPGEGRDAVEVVVKAAKKEDHDLTVVVRGHTGKEPGDTGTPVGRATLSPNGIGEIDGTLRFPVLAAQWSWLTVHHCLDDTGCLAGTEATRLRTHAGDVRVGAGIAPSGAKAVDVTVTAAGLAPGTTARVHVERVRGTARQPFLAVLAGGTDGTATWAPKVAVRSGDVVVVTYESCAAECGARVEVARYAVG